MKKQNNPKIMRKMFSILTAMMLMLSGLSLQAFADDENGEIKLENVLLSTEFDRDGRGKGQSDNRDQNNGGRGDGQYGDIDKGDKTPGGRPEGGKPEGGKPGDGKPGDGKPGGNHGDGDKYLKADISLEKSVDKKEFTSIGEVLTYTIYIRNEGDIPLGNVLVVDNMFGGNLGSPTSGDNGNNILDVGEGWYYIRTHTVTGEDIEAGEIDNTAKVSANYLSMFGIKTICDDDSVTVYKKNIKELSLVKTANKKEFTEVGEEIIYSYVVTNTGNERLCDVKVKDDKIEGYIYVGDLEPGKSKTVTASYKVTEADFESGCVINKAIAGVYEGKGHGGKWIPLSNEASVKICKPDPQKPAMSLIKSANPKTYSHAGQKIVYTFSIQNTGDLALTGSFWLSDSMLFPEEPHGIGLSGITVGVGETKVIYTHEYTITAADMEKDSITNTAYADHRYGEGEGDYLSDYASDTITKTEPTDPTEPTEPTTPPASGGGGGSTPQSPVRPDPKPATTVVEEEKVPLAPPVEEEVFVEEEQVPLAPPVEEVLEEIVPLAAVPKTGIGYTDYGAILSTSYIVTVDAVLEDKKKK